MKKFKGKKANFLNNAKNKSPICFNMTEKFSCFSEGKKAVLFSTDALIALIIIFLVVLIVYPPLRYSENESRIHSNIINVLSSLKIGEIENEYVNSLILSGKIEDLNKTLAEQIGEFYVTNKTLAETLSQEVLKNLDTNQNIGIWFGNVLLYSINSTPFESADNVNIERQTISGIREGESVTGFSARAYLTNEMQSEYYYFGGYVGDGNISLTASYSGVINYVSLEIATNNEFDIYINGIYSGHYDKSPSEFEPAKYTLSSYLSNFHSGSNIIEFRGNRLSILGGYLKIIYESEEYTLLKKYLFPGVHGLINIYDGFYIPGILNSMRISLHLDSDYKVFLIIGNKTIYNDVPNQQTVMLENPVLSSLLNYNELSKNTVPLRLGLENVSYILNYFPNVDIISVNDLSGSMADYCTGTSGMCCFFRDGCKTKTNCDYCSGTWNEKLSIVKNASKSFIDGILNYSGNRVGFVAYASSILPQYSHSLSDNPVSLKAKVDSWYAYGATCICCGINSAVLNLSTASSANKSKAMVVMSDGQANVRCNKGAGDARQDAINAACNAKNNYNITVHAVGFGSGADQTTLRAIATCGNGSYYYGDVDNIISIYQQVAQEIIEASYNEQRIESSGDFTTRIYPDSYIEFEFNESSNPYGLITSYENQFYNEYYGVFNVPENSIVLGTEVVSYSGPRWTSNVEINNYSIYDLSKYGLDYVKLGDPYMINIPNEFVIANNSVKVETGLSKTNITSGSRNNKIISRIMQNVTTYSPIVSLAEGCAWIIEFEDNSNQTLKIPSSYSGDANCYYTSNKQQYDNNDAIQVAIYELLKKLDLNNNYKVDIKFLEDSIKINSNEVSGIPFTWSSEIQVRRWY